MMAVKEVVCLSEHIFKFDDILSSPFDSDKYNDKYEKFLIILMI